MDEVIRRVRFRLGGTCYSDQTQTLYTVIRTGVIPALRTGTRGWVVRAWIGAQNRWEPSDSTIARGIYPTRAGAIFVARLAARATRVRWMERSVKLTRASARSNATTVHKSRKSG